MIENRTMTEDEVRDKANLILDFIDSDDARSGTGQITTFNQLGFLGFSNKPDGWYLPKDKSKVAIILETKAENVDIDTDKCIREIRNNCEIVRQKYDEVIGILYNGKETRAFRNNKPIDVPNELQNRTYYVEKVLDKPIDKKHIYSLTAKINNCLHFDFGIKNLYHRMIFTACALVAERYNKHALMFGMDYQTFHTSILSTLSKSLQDSRIQNQKLDILLEVYGQIRMNSIENQKAIDDFINWVKQISAAINSSYWRGEDVMGIFFNEFNRYKKKSESGQVFTPDHITSFMYRLIDCNMNDVIFDGACGSGAFLVKSMSNMIDEAGGINTNKAKEIKANRLYGIEFDREIFALACANMLIHKDGKTNLEQLDTRTDKACEWIRSKPITKVLMNPPFENKYGCIDIVKNVLDNVPNGTKTAFILPDKKLEKVSKKKIREILLHHRILQIIKLPEKLFNIGNTTSIFVIETGRPQGNTEIYACYIEDDGLETVKNQGRQDVRGKWLGIENYWIDTIYKLKDSKYATEQWINPQEHLSYQMPKKDFSISKHDINKVMTDYLLYQENVDLLELGKRINEKLLYCSEISETDDKVTITIRKNIQKTNKKIDDWKGFRINDVFTIKRPSSRSVKKYEFGSVPFISSGGYDNGVDSYREPLEGEELDEGNCLSVSPVDGSVFYQPIDFLGRGGGGSSIILLYNDNLNELRGLFISAVIESTLKQKYYYGDMGSSETIKDDIIKLPVDENGEIDWIYMENEVSEDVLEIKSNIDKILRI